MKSKSLTLTLSLLLAGSSALLACSDDDDSPMDTEQTGGDDSTGGTMQTGGDDSTGGMMGTGGDDTSNPQPRGMDNPPTVGAQLDRIGRPAISAALVGTFTETDDDARGILKDAYNAADDASSWVDDYTNTIAQNLAVLDGLDRTCGNQLAFDFNGDGSGYMFLASVLANDRLWVNGESTHCDDTYLGVELAALGVLDDGGCGGRALGTDVVDISYSALAAGDLTASIGDGVGMDDMEVSSDFPFLAEP